MPGAPCISRSFLILRWNGRRSTVAWSGLPTALLPADAGVATPAAAAPAGVPSEPALSSTRLAGERAAAAVRLARAAARVVRWAEAPERADLGIVKAKISISESDRTARIYVALGAQSDPRLSSASPSQLLRKGLRTRVSRPIRIQPRSPCVLVSSRVDDLA